MSVMLGVTRLAAAPQLSANATTARPVLGGCLQHTSWA